VVFPCFSFRDGIDFRLVTEALGLEPLEYVSVHSQRDRCLWADWLEALANDSPDIVLHLCLGMLGGGLDVPVRQGANPGPASPGDSGGGSILLVRRHGHNQVSGKEANCLESDFQNAHGAPQV